MLHNHVRAYHIERRIGEWQLARTRECFIMDAAVRFSPLQSRSMPKTDFALVSTSACSRSIQGQKTL